VSTSTDHATLLREESSYWEVVSCCTKADSRIGTASIADRHTSGSSSNFKTSRLLVLEVADLAIGLHM
jgi:hypothetical protein